MTVHLHAPSLRVAGVRRDEPSGYHQYRGSLSAAFGPLFEVVDTATRIVLTRVKLAVTADRLLAVSTRAASGIGTHAELVAQDQRLDGRVEVDGLSTASVVLRDGSRLVGTIDASGIARSVNVTLDGSSTWVVTGTSHVDRLRGLTMNGPTVINIHGDGHTVHYRAATNPTLAGREYPLARGGVLAPA